MERDSKIWHILEAMSFYADTLDDSDIAEKIDGYVVDLRKELSRNWIAKPTTTDELCDLIGNFFDGQMAGLLMDLMLARTSCNDIRMKHNMAVSRLMENDLPIDDLKL